MPHRLRRPTRRPLPRVVALAVLCATVVLAAGCTAGWVTRHIVEPPRSAKQLAFTERMLERARVPIERLERSGAPDIAFAVVEPGDFGLRYRTWSFEDDTWAWTLDWHPAIERRPATRGTVVLLHGWSMDAGMMLPWGMAFAERGYRAVLVELRGHGRSDDGPIGYGLRESDDVVAVIRYLRAAGRTSEPVYLFGVSFGAVTALHAAARFASEPSLQPVPVAVVAMEPFANAADAIRSMHVFATTAMRGSWRRWVLRNSARMLVGKNTLEAAIQGASVRLDLDLARLDTSVALAATRTCPLLVHGRIDTVIPHESSRALASVHADAQLVELPQDGHFSTPGRLDLLADPIADWFAALDAAGGDCAPFAAPPSTLLGYDGFEAARPSRSQRAQMRPPGGAVRVDLDGRTARH